MQRLKTGADEQVFALVAKKAGNKVVAIFNLSDKPQNISIDGALNSAGLKDILTSKAAPKDAQVKMTLKPWEYKVFAK